ncbi:cutinase family protein [Gordonia sp. OPL2]|uniref:cutinase family protein n=1 Tax=Gordonia sp. OPL2 TaxID=2486274 RepID=UPI001655A5DC|nr:cutinase family protein [Gordonia sp. OPL2]ROZ89182.1 cutinase family protein [Gordonia sp. OPL2]
MTVSTVLRRVTVSMACLAMALSGSLIFSNAQAKAAPCSDVEVIFARGTIEPAPPMGVTGVSFVEAVRSQLPGKSVSSYGVKYPASDKFNNRLAIANSVTVGVRSAQSRIKYLAANCPGTRVVLGGYSQGAVVAGFTTATGISVPSEYRQYASQVPPPLPGDVADNIAAVVLFAPPSDRFLRDIGSPPIEVDREYKAKTKSYCIAGDNICDGAPAGQPNGLHVLYSVNGMTLDAADYVKRHL